MSAATQVLHRSARPISVWEFYNAIQATCLPRFPIARGTAERPVGIAVSGGVDSMALSYLCHELRKNVQNLKLVDNKVSKFMPIIIDHGLREGSQVEADKVANALRRFKSSQPAVIAIRWQDILPDGQSPNDQPNIEALARHWRYRKIAEKCTNSSIATLLLAHHEDDQYETVLMRLIAGHGYRGLGGMRASNDIPECYDMHKAYQSGLIDDQLRKSPFWNMTPRTKQYRDVKNALLQGVDFRSIKKEVERGVRGNIDFDFLEDYEGIARGTRRVPQLTPLKFEDGGVMIYRPLLQFSKDRLIATCLENNIPWFEDHTNADPTYTTRNTLRYIAKNYQLPVALQKPAILQLSERCKARVAREEAEADRLLSHLWIRDFEPGVGTLVVQTRPFKFPSPTRIALSSPSHRKRRREHCRLIAALLIRRLLRLVAPERELPLVAQLDHAVSLIFPELADPSELKSSSPPKGYTICGVQFTPLIGDYPLRWLLSRAPYPSNHPRPEALFWSLTFRRRYDKHPKDWKWNNADQWQLYDGRYWANIKSRLPCKVRLAPFEPEHLKSFRENLADDNERAKLSLMLKRYAPAKVRWTLPAIYSTFDVSKLLKTGEWWPTHVGPEAAKPLPEGAWTGTSTTFLYQFGHQERLKWENEILKEGKVQLLALPTLGFQVAGLEKWLEAEVRYRKVDERVMRAYLPGRIAGVRVGIPRTRSRRDAERRRDYLRAVWRGGAHGEKRVVNGKRRIKRIRAPGGGE